MSTSLVWPAYKGMVNDPSQDAVGLLNGTDPETGSQMAQEQYVNFVRDQRRKNPELTQDIARASVAALLANRLRYKGEEAMLICVEGCTQRIGHMRLTGSQIMRRLWENVVPQELQQLIPRPLLEDTSDCTVTEIRALRKYIHHGTGNTIHPITHEYHRDRVDQLVGEEFPVATELPQDKDDVRINIPIAMTPEMILQFYPPVNDAERFVADVVEAATPLLRHRVKEAILEKCVLTPLHSVSRITERWTGWNPELAMARKRKDRFRATEQA